MSRDFARHKPPQQNLPKRRCDRSGKASVPARDVGPPCRRSTLASNCPVDQIVRNSLDVVGEQTGKLARTHRLKARGYPAPGRRRKAKFPSKSCPPRRPPRSSPAGSSAPAPRCLSPAAHAYADRARHPVERFHRRLPALERFAIGGERHHVELGQEPEKAKAGATRSHSSRA
jgi:hypothetical protein